MPEGGAMGDESTIEDWLRANLGGEVVGLRRQPRWRLVWLGARTVGGTAAGAHATLGPAGSAKVTHHPVTPFAKAGA
jgi:hypothetical protein